VRVAHAPDVEPLFGIAGRGNRGVTKHDPRVVWRRLRFTTCIPHPGCRARYPRGRDRPAGSARRRADRDDVAADGDQGRADPVTLQDDGRLVGGEAFPDSAEIDLHPRQLQLRGASAHDQLVRAGDRQGGANAIFRRQLVEPARAPPQVRERTRRHVEGAAADACQPLRFLEHAKEVIADPNGAAAGAPAQRRQLAVVAVVAHHRVERRDPRERVRRGVARGPLRPRVDDDAGLSTHLAGGKNVPRA